MNDDEMIKFSQNIKDISIEDNVNQVISLRQHVNNNKKKSSSTKQHSKCSLSQEKIG
jgi:hypothetical protein